ncbi:MAG: ribosomal protein S27E [Candidatus Woesearchaeota archaeon]|jgi:ribosomal protein S27E
MVFITENEQNGLCPYCYHGTLAYDDQSKRVYCVACKYAIKLNVGSES